jgi:hypothetical protein
VIITRSFDYRQGSFPADKETITQLPFARKRKSNWVIFLFGLRASYWLPASSPTAWETAEMREPIWYQSGGRIVDLKLEFGFTAETRVRFPLGSPKSSPRGFQKMP